MPEMERKVYFIFEQFLTTPFLVFGVGPLLDFIFGKYTRNPSQETEKALEADGRYKILTIFCLPIQLAVVIWGA